KPPSGEGGCQEERRGDRGAKAKATPRRRWIGRERTEGAAGLRQIVANRPELPGEVLRRGVAVPRFLPQASLHRPAQRRRDRGIAGRDRLGLILNDGRQGLRGRGAPEWPASRRHFVEDRAEGKLVGSKVDGRCHGLLGRHVIDRPENGSLLGRERDG